MIVSHENDDYEPLAWVRGHPVYVTTLLLASHVLALVVACLILGFHRGAWLGYTTFAADDVVRHGWIWQWATYAWIHPFFDNWSPITFLWEMSLFFWCGREVERYIGRGKFSAMYALLVVVAPILLTLFELFRPHSGGFSTTDEARLTLFGLMPGFNLAGSICIHFAVFIGFATLYPSVEFLFNIPAKILAWALLFLYTLFYFAHNDWMNLTAMWVTSATAWLFIQWVRGLLPIPQFTGLFARRPENRPVQRVSAARTRRAPVERPPVAYDDPVAKIDPLLDKIAREGINSLTAKERAELERAREKLLDQSKTGKR